MEKQYRDTDDALTLSAMLADKETRKRRKCELNAIYGNANYYGKNIIRRHRRMSPFQAVLTLLTMTGWRILSSGNRRKK
jgi:hypothetical protein